MENKEIYIITTSWGEYEMNHDAYEGYVYTEAEAIEAVKQLEERYNLKHPIAGIYDEFEQKIEYDNLKFEFEKIYYEWEDIEQSYHEQWIDENNITSIIRNNYQLYYELQTKYEADIKIKREEWFVNNKDAQKYLPNGRTWKDVLDDYDTYTYVNHEDYCGASYEKISYFKF